MYRYISSQFLYKNGCLSWSSVALISRERRRRRLLAVSAVLLAGEGQQQQHGQVPQAAEEELAGAVAVSLLAKAKSQVADVQVDG